MKISSAEYVISAFRSSQFPKDGLPEVAFAGRSNVGKSSLLNCLLGERIAKTSGTPGKTRAVNFFLINHKYYFVDLPGYGYARVSKSMLRDWRKLMEGYIGGRPNLRAVVVIIDARREAIPLMDLQMIEYVRSVGVACIPVFTKVDKLNRSGLSRLKKISPGQLPAGIKPTFFSSLTREGLGELQRRISDHLA